MDPVDYANNLTYMSTKMPLGAWNSYMKDLSRAAPAGYYQCFASMWIIAYYITLPTSVADAVIPPLEQFFLPDDVRHFMDSKFIP